MPIVLALSCAIVYGVADYCGGRATRVHPAAVVATIGQTISLALVLLVVIVLGTPVAPAHDWLFGGLAGAAGGLGLISFYHALGHGAMTVVAPTTAVIGAVLPVVVGLAQGERPRPVALVGVVLAIVCVALVSGAGAERATPTPRRVMLAAAVAGLGFGTLFVMLDHTSAASGLWPLVAARVTSVPLVGIVVIGTGARPGRDRRVLRFAVVAGLLDMGANMFYLAAVRGGLLSIVAVVSSLYPVSTVALASGLDGERMSLRQAVGLGLAILALTLVALGRT